MFEIRCSDGAIPWDDLPPGAQWCGEAQVKFEWGDRLQVVVFDQYRYKELRPGIGAPETMTYSVPRNPEDHPAEVIREAVECL